MTATTDASPPEPGVALRPGWGRRLRDAVPLLPASLLALLLLLLAWRDFAAQDVFDRGVPAAQLVTAVAGGIAAALWVARFLRGPRPGAATRRGLGRFRLLFVGVVLGWLAMLLWMHPFSPARTALFGGAALGLTAAVDLVGPWLQRRLPRPLVRGVDFALTMACFLVVALELGLRALAACSDSPLLLRPAAGVAETLGRFRLAPGTMWVDSRVNSGGHFDGEFGPRRPGVGRIVAIGDSFSLGAVPHYYHHTTVIERWLRPVEVCNLGVSAIGPREYLHLLQTEGLALQPDVVLVGLFVGNDLEPELQAEHPWLSSWCSAEGSMMLVVGHRAANVLREQRALGRDDVAAPLRADAPVAGVPDLHRVFGDLADPQREHPSMTDATFLAIEQARARLVCRPSAGLDSCRVRMREIVAAAGAVPVVFVLIPDEFQVEDGLWQQVGDASLERDLPQRELGAWCTANGCHCVDLLPDLRGVPPMSDGRLHVYYARNTHWNRRGCEVAGAAIARYLARHFGFPATSPAPAFVPYGVGCATAGGAPPALGGAIAGGALMLQVRGGPPLGNGLIVLGRGAAEMDLLGDCRVRILPVLPESLPFQCDAAGACDVPLALPAAAPSPLFLQAGFLGGGARAATVADFLQAAAGAQVALSNGLCLLQQ